MNERGQGAPTATSEAQVAEALELWVENTAVRIKDDPESGARQIQALYTKIGELEVELKESQALHRVTELRLATADELAGDTPVAWSTGPNVMGVRLRLVGAKHNGSVDVIQARVLRSRKGRFRVQTLVDEYRRGRLEGKHEALGTKPSLEEYQALNRDYCMTGDLTQAVIAFCQPKNLAPALKAAGFEDKASWFDAQEEKVEDKAAEGEAPPEPKFEG